MKIKLPTKVKKELQSYAKLIAEQTKDTLDEAINMNISEALNEAGVNGMDIEITDNFIEEAGDYLMIETKKRLKKII